MLVKNGLETLYYILTFAKLIFNVSQSSSPKKASLFRYLTPCSQSFQNHDQDQAQVKNSLTMELF